MTTIYDLSWKKISFYDKLQLFFASRKECQFRIGCENIYGKASAYSALSSTYYSILGTAYAQLETGTPTQRLLCLITWLPLAIWCYWRMLPLSNKVVELIGYENMSAEQCDIRQSILRRRKRLKEAEKCIRSALEKCPEKHTRGLLYVGLAEIHFKNNDSYYGGNAIDSAIHFANLVETTEPLQSARIYRNCANILELNIEGSLRVNELREKACSLAMSKEAKDQLLKLNV